MLPFEIPFQGFLAGKAGGPLNMMVGVVMIGLLGVVMIGLLVAVRSTYRRKQLEALMAAGGGSTIVPSAENLVEIGQVRASTVQPTAMNGITAGSGLFGGLFGKNGTTPLVDPDVPKDGSYLGKLSFRLSYEDDYEQNTMSIHILEAMDLRAMDMGGSSDPYVRVTLLPGYDIKTIGSMTLCIQVMDYDRFSLDDPIGEVLLPLRHVKFRNGPVYWKRLQPPTVHKEYVGELLLSLCYLPQTDKLDVVVNKGKALAAKDLNGSSDPYVKLWWVQNGIKMEKHKTSVKSQCLNPVYKEAFTFTLPPKSVLQKDGQLVVTVMDHDLLSSNDEIGHIVIGTKSGVESGIKHWKDVLAHPDQPIPMWHLLSPKW